MIDYDKTIKEVNEAIARLFGVLKDLTELRNQQNAEAEAMGKEYTNGLRKNNNS